MKREYRFITDGEFTLQETQSENQFFFYRNDGDYMEIEGREPAKFYQAYVAQKMLDGELSEEAANSILLEKSDDGKWIKITVC